MGMAPDCAVQASLAARASAQRSPTMTRSAPQRRMHSIFSGEATLGTKIFAGMPNLPAAKATATPWFPPEAATTPAFWTSRVSRLAKAPRALKEPACCKNSSLKMRLIESRRKSAPAASRMGVRRTWGLMIFSTAAICERSSGFLVIAAIPFQQGYKRKAGPSASLGMTSIDEERQAEGYSDLRAIIVRDLAKCLYES